MKKRITAMILALVLVLGILPGAAALEVLDEGICGAGLSYVHTGDGVLTVRGEGTLNGAAWKEPEQIRTVIIEEGCTAIGEAVFLGCTELTRVELPETLTAIGAFAFGDTGLTRVTIPGGVTTVEADSFAYSGLMTVLLEAGVTEVEDRAFYGCDNVTVCYFPKSLTQVGKDNFGTGEIQIYYEGTDVDWRALRWDSSNEGVGVRFRSVPSDVPDEDVPPEKKPEEVPVEPVNPFEDVDKRNYFYQPVLWAVENNITTGMDENHFSPDSPCTRGQVVTFLWRAAGEPEPASARNPFVDVAPTDYFYKAVLWAVEQGITTGMDSTHFGPNNACTRAQVATFLWRSEESPRPGGDHGGFGDIKYTDYYYRAVLWAIENGITTGMDQTHFGTGATCTRGQIVTFLYRAKDVEGGSNELTEEDLYYTMPELIDLRTCVESGLDYVLRALDYIAVSYNEDLSRSEQLYQMEQARACSNVGALWLASTMWIMDSNYDILLEGGGYERLQEPVLEAYEILWNTKERSVTDQTYRTVREPMTEELIEAGSILAAVYDLLYELIEQNQ